MFRHKQLNTALICFSLFAWSLVPRLWAQESPGRPAALPGAKEELLGELSVKATEAEEVVLSDDGMRFAAKVKSGKNWVLVVDGKEGPEFKDIARLSFSRPDGKHLIYAAKRSNKWVEMMDDKELGAELDALVPDVLLNVRRSPRSWVPLPNTSPNAAMYNSAMYLGTAIEMIATRYGQPTALTAGESREMQGSSWVWDGDVLRRHAYGGKRGNKCLMIVDGKEGPEFDNVGAPAFSPDGQRLAYAAKQEKRWRMIVDGKEGPELEELGGPVFSLDSQRLAYAARQHKHWLMIADGNAGPEFDEISPPYFSPDGRHVAYWGGRQTENPDGTHVQHVVVVVDGKEGPEFEEAGPPVFSPDGQHVAYWAKGRKEGHVVIVDGEPKFEFERILAGPKFSPDSQHIAYVQWLNGGFVGTLDDKSVGKSKAPVYWTSNVGQYFAGEITFSPDSQRLAYVVGWGGGGYWKGTTQRAKRRVVMDGREDDLYDSLGIDLTFSSDSRHLVYFVHGGLKKNKSTVVIDGQEAKPYDDVIGGVLREVEDSGPSRHALVYIAREGPRFYRVTQPLP